MRPFRALSLSRGGLGPVCFGRLGWRRLARACGACVAGGGFLSFGWGSVSLHWPCPGSSTGFVVRLMAAWGK